jgi:hypothetical protein
VREEFEYSVVISFAFPRSRCYLQQIFREVLREMNNCSMSVNEYWMFYNILKGVKNIDPFWEMVTSTCMN